jgi:hypothetical protein
MKAFIERMKNEKTTHERRQFAFRVATVLTGSFLWHGSRRSASGLPNKVQMSRRKIIRRPVRHSRRCKTRNNNLWLKKKIKIRKRADSLQGGQMAARA